MSAHLVQEETSFSAAGAVTPKQALREALGQLGENVAPGGFDPIE